jgi:hypothetical protein
VLCTDGPQADYPVAAWIEGDASPSSLTLDGRLFVRDPPFLRNVQPKKVKKEGWVNIYPESDEHVAFVSHAFATEREARLNRMPRCITAIRIEWEENE